MICWKLFPIPKKIRLELKRIFQKWQLKEKAKIRLLLNKLMRSLEIA